MTQGSVWRPNSLLQLKKKKTKPNLRICRPKSNIHRIVVLPDTKLLFLFDFSLFEMRVWHALLNALFTVQDVFFLSLFLGLMDNVLVKASTGWSTEEKWKWVGCCNFIFIMLAMNLEGRGLSWSVLISGILLKVPVLLADRLLGNTMFLFIWMIE